MRAAAVLFSHHLEDDVPHPVAGIAFHKCEILPGADRDLAVNEGNRDKGRQDQGVDVGGTIIIVPGVMVAVVDDMSLFIAVGGDALHGFPHVVLYKSGLEFERRQRPPLIKTG